MASLKQKGDLADLKVATDLIDRGCHLSFPYGEDCDYDLIADKGGILHRIQVKYTESDGRVVTVRCQSHLSLEARYGGRSTTQQRQWIGLPSTTEHRAVAFTVQQVSWAQGEVIFAFA